MPDIIKLKRATKSVFKQSTKVLEKDEIAIATPDSGSGKGKCQLYVGDGITQAKNLPVAIDGENADDYVVATLESVTEENPTLNNGDTVKKLFGKVIKKFTYLGTQINGKVTTSGGDIADTKVSAFTASAAAYPVPVAGETPRVFMGKVKKFFEDIRSTVSGACFIGQIVNNCVTNNASLPLSAAQGKALMDLYIQLNSDLGEKITDLDNPVSGPITPNKLYARTYRASALHVPSNAHGTLYHMYLDGDPYAIQMSIDMDRKLFIRTKNNGAWSVWDGYVKNSDFDNRLKGIKYLMVNSNNNLELWMQNGDVVVIKSDSVVPYDH